ncbi:MAG: hypothetical protein LBM75_10510 [Myxococcales bacterium]|jgi:hypothetical protein|nr:hypothetical protein [Myxococcales bacterium]
MSRPLKLLLCLVALGLFVGPLSAQAWLFTADVLVRKVGVARRNMQHGETKLSSLAVRGTLHLIGDEARTAASALGLPFDPASPEIFVPAKASYGFPGRCRLEVQRKPTVPGPRLAASNDGGKRSLDTSGQHITVLEMFTDMACPLLDGRGGYEGPMALMRAAGVKRNVVTLGRVEGQQIAYVVGARPQQTNASSLWVNKETFQPLRFVDRQSPVSKELRFIDYDWNEAGRWHPRRIEFIQADRLIGTFTIDEALPNPSLNDAIF